MHVTAALDRRSFLLGAGALGALVTWRPQLALAQAPTGARVAMERSKLVYVSPLLADGSESRCHGEVWYFVDGGGVVLATAHDGWKARALAAGRDRARLWVGDFGRYRGDRSLIAAAPTVDARAARDDAPAVFERLLAAFAVRYPEEWGKWEPRFREGVKSGKRVVIRYTPQS
jgi:hypothetical protein